MEVGYYERPETSILLDHIWTASYGAQNDHKRWGRQAVNTTHILDRHVKKTFWLTLTGGEVLGKYLHKMFFLLGN